MILVGYKKEDLIYIWTSGDNSSVKITENITMSQFTLQHTTVKSYNYSRMNNTTGKEGIDRQSYWLLEQTGS